MSKGRWTEKLQKFRRLDSADKWLLVHATLWLALASIMLLVLPFRWLAKRLSAMDGSGGLSPDPDLLDRIGIAVRTAAGNVPWRSDCFSQSIAGQKLLKHHGYRGTIHLGVERSGKEKLAGHAWLTCNGTMITGGEDAGRYTEMLTL